VIVGGLGSGTGSTVRLISCAINCNGSKLNVATSKCVAGEFFITVSDFIVFGLVLSVSLTLSKYPMMAHLTLDVVPPAVRMLNPVALFVRAVTGKHKRGMKKTNKAFHIRDPNFTVLIFPVGSKR
jgi:hypothetical protein